MTNKDYIQQITNAVDYFLNHETELSETLRNKIKTFIAVRDEEYSFYPFTELLNLYRRHPIMFADYFDLNFISNSLCIWKLMRGNRRRRCNGKNVLRYF